MSYLNTGQTNNFFEGFFDFFQKEKTFRPRKKFESGTLRFNLHTAAQASLNSGINLKEAVKLPQGESQNDWVAVHVVDFFNRINLIYGTVCDYCTEKSCPKMSGGPKFEYLWQDGIQYKKPTPLSAPRYISLLMDWIESQINDERTFPTSTDSPFPRNFVNQICKKMMTRLFRVFVHVYIHHFDRIVALGAEAHVNTCYKHFYYFVNEFHLVPAKELEPLVVMTDKLLNNSLESTHRCINISAPIQQQQIIFEDCSGINPPSTLMMGTKISPNSDVNTLNTEFNNISLASTTNSSTSHHGGNNNHMQNQNIKVTIIEDN